MAVTLRKKAEQALNLHAPHAFEQGLHTPGAKVDQSLHHDICHMKGFVVGQLVEQFKTGALRRGDDQRPVPLSPVDNAQPLLQVPPFFADRLGMYGEKDFEPPKPPRPSRL